MKKKKTGESERNLKIQPERQPLLIPFGARASPKVLRMTVITAGSEVTVLTGWGVGLWGAAVTCLGLVNSRRTRRVSVPVQMSPTIRVSLKSN